MIRFIMPGRRKIPKILDITDNCTKNYVYLIRFTGKRGRAAGRTLYKIGTTNNIKRRMLELYKEYRMEKPIQVLWISRPYTKNTALKVESDFLKKVRKTRNWSYVWRDRFIIPKGVDKIDIKVRRVYSISV